MRTNQMPKTMQDYYETAKKQAEAKEKLPPPQEVPDKTIVNIPQPKISIKKYNNPPGMVETNLQSLKKKRKVNSIGVASPDGKKMVYTSMYYYPTSTSTSSEMYLMDLDTSLPLSQRLSDAHIYKGQVPVYKTGMSSLDLNVQRTLTILDWSADGRRVAIKEKISYSQDGLWKTNLLVYDFTTEKMKDLSEVREAIKYYWKKTEHLDLSDKRWDIFPVGWDAHNPDRLIVFAYAYTGERPRYLGAWSIDYYGDRSMLMSQTSSNFEVSQNGMCLKLIAD